MIFRCEMSAALEAIKFEINCFYNCAPCVWTVLSMSMNATHGLQRHCSAVWLRDGVMWLACWEHCWVLACWGACDEFSWVCDGFTVTCLHLLQVSQAHRLRLLMPDIFFYGFCQSSWLKWSGKYYVVGIVNCNMWSIWIYLIFFFCAAKLTS